MQNPKVDAYLARARLWPTEAAALRRVLLETGLSEELKWGKPCYSHDGRNIAIIQEMKGFLALMFFKGALLRDADRVLEAQGPNSRSARRIRFTSVAQVEALSRTIAALVDEAIDVEDAGTAPEPPPDLVLVDELERRLELDPPLRSAFEALTPGRRREYTLHIGDAKKAATREARIDRCVPLILAGKGLRDR